MFYYKQENVPVTMTLAGLDVRAVVSSACCTVHVTCMNASELITGRTTSWPLGTNQIRSSTNSKTILIIKCFRI